MRGAALALLPFSCAALVVPKGPHRRIIDERQIDANVEIMGGLRMDAAGTVTHTGSIASVSAAVVNFNQVIPTAARVAPMPTATWAADYSNGQYHYPKVNFSPVKRSNVINSTAYSTLTDLMPDILTHGVDITDKSWELGALVESILEVYHPNLTPFEYDESALTTNNVPWEAMKVALSALYATNWNDSPSSRQTTADIGSFISNNPPTPLQPRPLVGGDGALGDPAAIGAGTYLLAQFAGRDDVRGLLSMRRKEDYAWVAANQWAYLNNGVKSANGTISQREGHFELWADMGYMIPPFPAYLGLATKNVDLIRTGLQQWSLEASALLDPSHNLYRHVHYWDTRFWCTGQAWMLGGAMRLIASAHAAGADDELASLLTPISQQLAQVFYSVLSKLDGDNLIPNYIDEPDHALSHGDTAGTALIVASFYRYLTYFPSRVNGWLLDQADRAFTGVVNKVDSKGWVTQVVDPDGTNGFVVYLNLAEPMRSPEGQSFVALMWAARTAAGV